MNKSFLILALISIFNYSCQTSTKGEGPSSNEAKSVIEKDSLSVPMTQIVNLYDMKDSEKVKYLYNKMSNSKLNLEEGQLILRDTALQNALKQYFFEIQLPIEDKTVDAFKNKYQLETEYQLKIINPNINSFLEIKKTFLENIVKKCADNQFLSIHIVQIPKTVADNLNTTNPLLQNYIDKLYFFFNVTDAHGNVLNDKYIDLESSYTTSRTISKADFDACKAAFENKNNPNCLKNGLLKVANRYNANKNSEIIYCPINEMKSYFKVINSSATKCKYIKLDFTQIDITEDEIQKNQIKLKRLEKNNNDFGVIWLSLDANHLPIHSISAYDVNYLCPNNCP